MYRVIKKNVCIELLVVGLLVSMLSLVIRDNTKESLKGNITKAVLK